ncbi:Glycerol dehydrogenase [Commensalibacter sp. Nvir]|nr:Glycerol dehydrogenase [Commensalibacter sp. Nvir]
MGAIKELGEYIAELGHSVFVVADNRVWDIVEGSVSTTLKQSRIEFKYECFKGESSDNEIRRLAELARTYKTFTVMGLGGGKTLDTVKAVADELKQPVIIVPTIASTDAPCSALSVIYSEEGVFEKYRFYNRNPDLVLIDPEICVKAPVRLFASGIADGLATHIEAMAVKRTHSKSMVGGSPTIAAMAIAKACEKTLLTWGKSAYEAVASHVVTPAVEAVIEANTLLSGLGFENAGLAGAHAIHNGFTAISGEIHHLTHGEKVAYGTLTQLILEQRPDEVMAKYIRFYRSIKMPTTLKELHLESVSWHDLVKIGNLANSHNDTLKNLNANLNGQDVAYAILAVDALSRTLI